MLVLFPAQLVLGQDALLVQSMSSHDEVESLLFMTGLGYVIATILQTLQLLRLKRKRYVCALNARGRALLLMPGRGVDTWT